MQRLFIDDAKLDDRIETLGLLGQPQPTVREVMDATKYPYCYTCSSITFSP